MDSIGNYFKDLISQVNKCTLPQLIVTTIAGAMGILWPLGGLVLYLILKKTKFKLYGKVALTTCLISVFLFGFKQGVLYFINK